MQSINTQEAKTYLKKVGMTVGGWNEVTYLSESLKKKSKWIKYQAPRENMFNFSQHVAGWFPGAKWKILQIDNSTGCMTKTQACLFYGLLYGVECLTKLDTSEMRSFLFEFGKNSRADAVEELLVANIIYVFLLFDFHGYIVSSESKEGQLLGIQDGFIYFRGTDKGVSDVKSLIKGFESDPCTPPMWVSSIEELA